MKSACRKSKANGSTKRRVETIIRRGWRPGLGRHSDFYRGRGNRLSRVEAGSHGA